MLFVVQAAFGGCVVNVKPRGQQVPTLRKLGRRVFVIACFVFQFYSGLHIISCFKAA